MHEPSGLVHDWRETVRPNVALNGQLFLMGYSHGGHVTMALHRELEQYHANEITITASAPMAGAYRRLVGSVQDKPMMALVVESKGGAPVSQLIAVFHSPPLTGPIHVAVV